jgi:hypothetical protein
LGVENLSLVLDFVAAVGGVYGGFMAIRAIIRLAMRDTVHDITKHLMDRESTED